jgi:hypothetical protein
MTSIEWFREKLHNDYGLAFSDNLFEQAKEMHKTEIIDESCNEIEEFINWIDEKELPRKDNKWIMYYNGKDNYLTTRELFEQYYKETFKK